MSSAEEDSVLDSEFNTSDEEEDSESQVSGEQSHEVRVMLAKGIKAFSFLRNSPEIQERNENLPTLEDLLKRFKYEYNTLEYEDEDGQSVEEHDVHYVWSCVGYRVELYENKDRHPEDPPYRLRVLHKPRLEIVNTGFLRDISEINQMCDSLEQGDFETGMRILFKVRSHGSRCGQTRSPSELETIVENSTHCSTTDGLD